VQPRWRRDGKELFYVSGSTLMAVDVKTDEVSFEAGNPQAALRGRVDANRTTTVEQTSEPIQVWVNYHRHLLPQP
jgi:hypothetical protein